MKNTEAVDIIKCALLENGEVKVIGLGFFSIKRCKGGGKRMFRGQEVVVPDYNKITFRPSAGLKRDLKKYGG